LWRERYTPYGVTLDNAGANDDQAGYTGHIKDSDTGLVYMQARYYDPVIGRFYSNDPVGYTSQNPVMSFNRYLYVNNNPYKYTDPNGEFLWAGAAIGAAIGFVSSVGTQLYKNGSVDNWGTVAAATATGAAVGFTGGLATAAVGKIGLTGVEAFAAVATPSATVAAVGGGLTQIVNNAETGAPLNQNVATANATAAIGTIAGGALGQLGDDALTATSKFGGQGALNNVGKTLSEGVTTVTQEALTQGASATLDKIDDKR
jgi:RHS repeat-associated protein